MKRAFVAPALFLAMLFTEAACGPSRSVPPVKEYELQGEVMRLDSKRRVVTIRHQKIEGWMEAMTMDFPLREGEPTDNLKPGTHIRAKVYVQDLLFTVGAVRATEVQ